jgi:hypothetical protein
MSAPELPAIPMRDVREGGAVRHALENSDRARALRDDCLAWFPTSVQRLLPSLDAVTRRWLRRSVSPYVGEIEAIASGLSFPGIWFLNGSYEWGCTALARDDETPWLVRTLDWPFPGLGRHIEVAHMEGAAGEFYNVGWPGFVGVLTGMAPGRFAASINQAPLWRRTSHPWLRPYDMLANAVATWSLTHIPPNQLLRQVFEECATFDEAKARLERTPIARPAIYTLAGCKRGERCVIERTEDDHLTRIEETSAANDWLEPRASWEARVGGDQLFAAATADAGGKSKERRSALAAWDAPFGGGEFTWVTPPVLNPFTRIAVEMCPADGYLRVVGYEKLDGFDLPRQINRPREIRHQTMPDRQLACASA